MCNEFRIPHVTRECDMSAPSAQQSGGPHDQKWGGSLPLSWLHVTNVRAQCNIGRICGAVISLESTIFAIYSRSMPYILEWELYGGNSKAAKAESESINDRPKRTMIGRCVKTTEHLARQLQKCTGYMLPSFVYTAISCTELAAFVVWRELGEKGRSLIGQAHDLIFLSLTRATWSCSESDKFYGLQHIWYNVV